MSHGKYRRFKKGGIAMNFVEAVQSVFSNFLNFRGRARRSEFWYFFLFVFVISFILGVIQILIWGQDANYLTGIFSLIILIPNIAVSIRRLHDTGRSGFWYLIGFIPIIGTIILIIWYCQDSEPGDNKYGPNPKEYLR